MTPKINLCRVFQAREDPAKALIIFLKTVLHGTTKLIFNHLVRNNSFSKNFSVLWNFAWLVLHLYSSLILLLIFTIFSFCTQMTSE